MNKKPKWYLELNPLGQVPCLQFDDGRAIPESLIVCEYLDSAYPEHKLTPSDPYIKAQHQLIVESFSKVITIYYKVYRGDTTALPLLNEALESFEKKLELKFFGGIRKSFFDFRVGFIFFTRGQCISTIFLRFITSPLTFLKNFYIEK